MIIVKNVRNHEKTNSTQNDILWVFCYNVKDKVSAQVRDNVHFKINNDTIVFKVDNEMGIEFTYTITNIYHHIVHGISSEIVAETIVKMYKRYIINLHFK